MAVNYTRKVMEHMSSPRNVGKIDDADGVGTVGNPVCLVAGTEIAANPEEKGIDSVLAGEKVLAHDGKYHPVIEGMSRDFDGATVVIKNRFGETALTPEHEVLAIRVPKTHKFLYARNKKTLNPEWVPAGELAKGDIALYARPLETEDVAELAVDTRPKKHDFKSKKTPGKIRVDADFLRLCGYYLSEGNLRDKTTKAYVGFTFNLKETGYADDVARIVSKKFGVEARIKRIPKRTTLVVEVNNVFIVRLFKALFGKGAASKSLPTAFMKLPAEKQRGLLAGLWRGDGFINYKIPRAGYSTISKKLAAQLKFLLLRQGIIPSVYVEAEKTIGGVRHRRAYRIHVGNRDSVSKLAEIVYGERITTAKPESNDAWCDEKFAYVPITGISTRKYAGTVHNLLVEDAHSYLTTSLTVHNCGDVMSLYIKVRDDRIEDIKFLTYGCGAAIATSSMITELARGKTIDEALKISRGDVAGELGGLPPIKMHCSNLAADALHAAIQDYLKKRK